LNASVTTFSGLLLPGGWTGRRATSRWDLLVSPGAVSTPRLRGDTAEVGDEEVKNTLDDAGHLAQPSRR
jgi:hypothetical protein